MTTSAKKKLIATNAAIWAGATLLSFVLPMVADSVADGTAGFLKMMVHTGPLLLGLLVSSSLISNTIGHTSE